jgi:hypothetical protein
MIAEASPSATGRRRRRRPTTRLVGRSILKMEMEVLVL